MLFIVKAALIMLPFLGHYSFNHASEPILFIKKYKDNLPSLNDHEHYSSLSTEDRAKKITEYLCKFIPQKKALNIQGNEQLTNKLSMLIGNAQPISLVLLGFPFKSTNYEKKCLSKHVDMGEYLSLITLDTMVHNIQKIYSKANCVIISDGLAYHIDDYDPLYENILHYHETMSILVQQFQNLSFISWKIKDALLSHKDLQLEVSKVSCILNTTNNERYNEMSSFVSSEFDCSYWQNIFLKKAEELYAKEPKNIKPKLKEQEIRTMKNKLITAKSNATAIELVNKGKQFSTFVSQTWPNYTDCIRLSVHCDKNNVEINQKIPISLIYGHFGTPWHNTLVIDAKKDELNGFFKDIFKNKKDALTNQTLRLLSVKINDSQSVALQYVIK